MTLKGVASHRARLKALQKIDPVKELAKVAEVIRKDAADSIRAGAISGPGHVPSRPGEPPNADTHRLDTSGVVIMNKTQKTVRVLFRAPYAAWLEYGTSRMLERPFLRPALRRHRNRLVQGQVQMVNKVIRTKKN